MYDKSDERYYSLFVALIRTWAVYILNLFYPESLNTWAVVLAKNKAAISNLSVEE